MRPPPSAQSELLFDRFDLLSVLGEGGFGIVYRAHDRLHRADVALKVLHRMSADAVVRFKREFRSARELTHRNLIRLGELFEQDGRWAYSMELLDGGDFSSWTRPGGVLDEARLRTATLQLLGGLQALHASGLVHRDLKPQNVLVTREQRVVLLDFGLVLSLSPIEQTTTRHRFGTLAYMAPEQADASSRSAASDMYALGVLLYEALTGRLPFSGDTMQLLLAKYSQTPVPPRLLFADVPSDFDELTCRLLATQPESRPTAAEAIQALHGDTEELVGSRVAAERFVGRGNELGELAAQFAACRAGRPLLLLVCGEGGIGKSALIQRFLNELQARDPATQIFRGRCHAHEQVTYKALDEIVTQLSRACRARARAGLAVPASAPLLARLCSGFDYAPAGAELPLHVERAEMFEALLELIESLAGHAPVVFAIDDLQWCDRDSLDLLQYLLANCRARGFMVLVSTREEQPAIAGLHGIDNHSLRVGPLDREAALELAGELCAERTGRAALERIQSESGGHPLFLRELAHWSTQLDSGAVPPLDVALRARAALLESASRRTLELISVAGGPVPTSVLMDACGLPIEPLQQALRELRAAHFAGSASAAGDVLTFHDRVREAIVSGLDAATVVLHHAALARAWEAAAAASAARVAHHLLAAGEHARAAPWLDRAIDEALTSSAFLQAEQLCRLRIQHAGVETSAGRLATLQLIRSDALAASGSFASSAEVLLELVASAQGDIKRDALIRSAQRLLQAGDVARGMARAQDAMHAIDLPWSTRSYAIFARIAWHRLQIRSAGEQRDARAKPAARASGALERQLDTSWRLLHPLFFVDLRRCVEVSSRHLHLAAKAGDSRHLALGLAAHAVLETMADPRSPRGELLSQRARIWCEIDGSPDVRAYHAFASGGRAIFASQLRDARTFHEQAERIYASECSGEAWLRLAARGTYLATLFIAGHFDVWAQHCDAWMRDAEARGDAFGLAQYAVMGQGAVRHLMRDDPARARAELERAMRPWRACGFGVAQMAALRAADLIAAYEQVDPELRYRTLASFRSSLRGARDMVDERRGDALLRATLNKRGTTRAALQRLLSRSEHAGITRLRSLGLLQRAVLLQRDGDQPRARDLAMRARSQLDEQGVDIHARVAALVAARADGAESARVEALRLREHLTAQGWTNVERALVWVMPG